VSSYDELVSILRRRIGGSVGETVDDILAAGYQRPRTITTVEELDALPAGTIIRDPLPCIKWGSGMWGTFSGDSVGSNRIDFPATVLYEPQP
jgi:hypothetical protein